MQKTIGVKTPKHDYHVFRPKKTKYCICIPVINEGEKIKKQLSRMKPFSQLADIFILDGFGGSKDGSTKKTFLKSNNVRALLTLQEPGKQGTQLRMGFARALREGYEGIIQIDGNNKDGVNAIPRFIKALDEGFDYVQGSRFIKGGKHVNTPFMRTIGVRVIASPLLCLFSGHWYTDVTNGFRGYSKKYLLNPKVKPFRNIFVRYEFNLYLTTRANQLGFKTKEIPVERKYPKGKVPTKISPIKGNSDFFLTVFKVGLKKYHPN